MLTAVKRKIKLVINEPKTVCYKILYILSPLINDKTYLKLLFFLSFGYKLDLKNPQTYNEKLQWLKLYYRKPELTNMVDKYEVKKYVEDLIGREYVIPTLGVWNSFDEIDFDKLPNQFVLKTTHDQGGVVICKDKLSFDYIKARKLLNKHLKFKHFYLSREWPYKDVKPRIIAEKYMANDENEDLNDFKFFCFHGEPQALFIATERQTGNVKFDYFDMDFSPLELVQSYQRSGFEVKKPIGFEKMAELSRILTSGLPHVRVDFYNINGKIYFGELTFFHHGGLTPFHPEEWDYKFGNWIDLEKITCK
ncbi:ATP-grasp fold amidoligase family protein [Winogradskyella sp.]|uniref:ATP-grasp fold amidoligase family protein n=1 Tax=Winogradskyella sp. TaxID=1883156 RepID=UPI003AB2E9C5